MLLNLAFVAACATPPPSPASAIPAIGTAPATPSATVAKPAVGEAPLPPPTHVRWAVDKSEDPAHPFLLDLFYDGTSTDFRIFDGSGRLFLRVPIAGSGIFGPETCVQRARPGGKVENFTWIGIDAGTLEQFIANASSFRVEADSVAGPTMIVPLGDSGCRGV